MADHELNAEGLNCPLPILKTKKALKAMASGDTLKVRSTDAGSVADFAAFCTHTGNELLSTSTEAGVHIFEIKCR